MVTEKNIKNKEEYYRKKVEEIADIVCELQTLSKDKVNLKRIMTDVETWEGYRIKETMN